MFIITINLPQEACRSDSGLRAVVQKGYETQGDKPICPYAMLMSRSLTSLSVLGFLGCRFMMSLSADS